MNIYLLCLRKKIPAVIGQKIKFLVGKEPEVKEYEQILREYFGPINLGGIPPLSRRLLNNRIILVFLLAKRLKIILPKPIRLIIKNLYINGFYNLALSAKNYDATVSGVCANKDPVFAYKFRHDAGTVTSFLKAGVTLEKFFLLDHITVSQPGQVYMAVLKANNNSNILLAIQRNYVTDQQKMLLSFKCGACSLAEKYFAPNGVFNSKIIKWVCQGNYMDCMLLILQKGNDNYAISHVAWNFASVEMISLLAKWNVLRYSNATDMVCRRGNLEVVKFLIGQGAFNFPVGFTTACLSKNYNIVEFLIGIGIVTNVDAEIFHAWQSNDIRLFDKLIRTASRFVIMQIGMQSCEINDLRILKKICTYRQCNTAALFLHACKVSKLEVVEYFGKLQLDWNAPLYEVCRAGNLPVLKFLLAKGANKLELGIKGAVMGGRNDICTFLLNIKN